MKKAPSSLTVKCLKLLPLTMANSKQRHLLKALETFCFVKALWVDRPMKNDPESREKLAEVSLRHPKTIKRRIDVLKREGWLLVNPHTHALEHISWEKLQAQYGIAHNRFYHLKPCEHVELEYLLKAKIFSEKKEHCRFGYKAHLRREFYRAKMISEVSGTLSSEAVAEHQLINFLSEGRAYDQEGSFALSLHYKDRRTDHLNGDLEINYKTGTKVFSYQSRGGFAVLKRSLARKGVIHVQSRRTDLARKTNTTTAARKTRLGFVKWNEGLRKVQLIQPDLVTVTANRDVDFVYQNQKRWKAEIDRATGAKAA